MRIFGISKAVRAMNLSETQFRDRSKGGVDAIRAQLPEHLRMCSDSAISNAMLDVANVHDKRPSARTPIIKVKSKNGQHRSHRNQLLVTKDMVTGELIIGRKGGEAMYLSPGDVDLLREVLTRKGG